MFQMIQNCNTWKVLACFLDEPTKKHQIRQISRKINLATTSVKKHIETLIKENLVEEGEYVFKYYRANFDNKDFRFYKKINTLMRLKSSKLIDYLERTFTPDVIMLFGSCAKGEDTERSDIDIYIQSKGEVPDLKKFEEILGRKIELFVHENINNLPKELRNNILNGTKISGYLKVF